MTENPYRLTRDVRGIFFKTADAIAMRLGIEKTAMDRLRACDSFALAEAMDEGHCGLTTAELIPLAEGLLEAAPHLIETALHLERSETPLSSTRSVRRAARFLRASTAPSGPSPVG
jgi:exodeoxyribonuclease V alpha subunit